MRDAATGKMIQPRCRECGAVAHYGFGVKLLKGETGAWYCLAHRDIGEARLAAGDFKATVGSVPTDRGDQKKVVRKNDQGSLL